MTTARRQLLDTLSFSPFYHLIPAVAGGALCWANAGQGLTDVCHQR
ncbi:hypothetical protein SHAM105786_07500 [Shewanella amazonensis]